MMEMQPVASTNIVAIGYDPQNEILAVQFKKGIYHYNGFPEHLFQAFQEAPSKGKFLRAYILNQYPYDKVG